MLEKQLYAFNVVVAYSVAQGCLFVVIKGIDIRFGGKEPNGIGVI